jgi:hypothetical protein
MSRKRDKVISIEGQGKRKRKPRPMTPELLAELIAIHGSCVLDQQGRCPLPMSVKSLCWEIKNR